MNVRNWKKVAQNSDSWKKAVEQARTLYRLQRLKYKKKNCENFIIIKCMVYIVRNF